MEVQPDTITSDPHSLRLGLVIYGPKKSWVKFAEVTIPWEAFPESVLVHMMHSRLSAGPPEEDTPLF